MPTRSFAPQPAGRGRIHAYLRVSKPDQAEPDRTSLDEQDRIIREHVARYRPNASIVVWREEGISGAIPLAQRPTAKNMLADLRPGETVVCTRVDRLSRHMTSACAQIEAWQRQDIKVMLLDLPINPGTDWDAAAMCCFHMLMAFAQFERQRIASALLPASAPCRRGDSTPELRHPSAMRSNGSARASDGWSRIRSSRRRSAAHFCCGIRVGQ